MLALLLTGHLPGPQTSLLEGGGEGRGGEKGTIKKLGTVRMCVLFCVTGPVHGKL